MRKLQITNYTKKFIETNLTCKTTSKDELIFTFANGLFQNDMTRWSIKGVIDFYEYCN